MDIKKVLKRSSDELRKNNVSEPEKSAEFLLRQVLAPSLRHSRPPLSFPRRRESSDFWRVNSGGNPIDTRAWLLANPDYELNAKQEKKFLEFIERRKKHEPVWYITGKIEFYGLDLEVNQDVLIPRPETELLVEEVLSVISAHSSVIPAEAGIQKDDDRDSRLRGNDNIKILELGTGSGAIALSLANKFKIQDSKFKILASDISGDALKVARKNAKKLGFEKATHNNFAVGMVKTPGVKDPKTPGVGPTEKLTIEFREGDLFEPWNNQRFDIIVANLPYIPHEEMASLALDIHHWEPRTALDGGKEGLEIYERLLAQAGDYLNEDAMMFFEIGIGQGVKIKKLVKKHFPKARVEIKKDYAGIDRIAVIHNQKMFQRSC